MPRRAIAPWLALAAVCCLAFVLRTTNAATVFVGDAVVFAENDPYYHMRRVFQVLADYPRVPGFDPWIDHPSGAPIVFAPLFDLGIASAAKLVGFDAGDVRAVETLAALLPPLLGALTCVATFWLALQTASPGAALLAALLLALVPAHVWYSRLGFVDHHVAVTLLFVALCALALRALAPLLRPDADTDPRALASSAAGGGAQLAWPAAVLATLTLAAGVLSWNGFLLLVAVLDAALLAMLVVSPPSDRRAICRLALILHGGAALVVVLPIAAIVRQSGAATSTVTLSYLHVAVLIAMAAASAIAERVSGRRWSARDLVVLAIVVVAAVAAVMLTMDGVARMLGSTGSVAAGVARWLLASDPFMGSVQESVPIVFTSDGRLDLGEPLVWMSGFFLVVPVLLALLAWRLARRRFADRGRLFVLVWAGLLFFLTLGQRRFAETFAPALAVLVADFLVVVAVRLRTLLRARGVGRRPARLLAGATVALLVVLAFAPYYRGFVASPGRVTSLLRAPLLGRADAATTSDRAAQAASSDVRLQRALHRFGALKREAEHAAPEPSSVMNPWPLGHKLLYVAQTPVTATPFGSYVGGTAFEDWIDFFLTGDEAQALAILERRGSRWVVVDNDLGTIGAAIVGRGENPRDYYGKVPSPDGVVYTYQPPLLRSLYLRLTKLAGSELRVPAPDGDPLVIPALDHLRLVLDSASDDAIGFPKAYEVVQGARLALQAAPGAEVIARYAYRSDAGRDRVHEKTARADTTGTARLVLPYSSERPDLGQTSAWTIEVEGTRHELRVPEAAVRDGGAVSLTPG